MVCQNDAPGKEVEGRHEPESAHREAETGFLVVGVGASGAGGVQPVHCPPAPADCGMTFVLIQHLQKDVGSHLVEVVARAIPNWR